MKKYLLRLMHIPSLNNNMFNLVLDGCISQRPQSYKFYVECAKLAKGGSMVGV